MDDRRIPKISRQKMGRIIKTRRSNKQVKKRGLRPLYVYICKNLLNYGKNKKQKNRMLISINERKGLICQEMKANLY